jgi:hypothetical protein
MCPHDPLAMLLRTYDKQGRLNTFLKDHRINHRLVHHPFTVTSERAGDHDKRNARRQAGPVSAQYFPPHLRAGLTNASLPMRRMTGSPSPGQARTAAASGWESESPPANPLPSGSRTSPCRTTMVARRAVRSPSTGWRQVSTKRGCSLAPTTIRRSSARCRSRWANLMRRARIRRAGAVRTGKNVLWTFRAGARHLVRH